MQSWDEMLVNAKNKRRSKPKDHVRSSPSKKKKKKITVEIRYMGEDGDDPFWPWSDYYGEGGRKCSKYPTLKAAEMAVKTLNKQNDRFEYRIKKDD